MEYPVLRKSRTPKKRAKLKGRGLRWRLKQIARDYEAVALIGVYLVGDYLDDGIINGSLVIVLAHLGLA